MAATIEGRDGEDEVNRVEVGDTAIGVAAGTAAITRQAGEERGHTHRFPARMTN